MDGSSSLFSSPFPSTARDKKKKERTQDLERKTSNVPERRSCPPLQFSCLLVSLFLSSGGMEDKIFFLDTNWLPKEERMNVEPVCGSTRRVVPSPSLPLFHARARREEGKGRS